MQCSELFVNVTNRWDETVIQSFSVAATFRNVSCVHCTQPCTNVRTCLTCLDSFLYEFVFNVNIFYFYFVSNRLKNEPYIVNFIYFHFMEILFFIHDNPYPHSFHIKTQHNAQFPINFKTNMHRRVFLLSIK